MKLRFNVMFVLCASCVVACKSPPPPAAPPPPQPVVDPGICDLEPESEVVWNPTVRDSLDLSVKIMDDIIEAWEAETLTVTLDTFTADWASKRTSACRDHYFDQKTSRERYDEQEACFQRMLVRAQEIVDLMRAGDRAALAQSEALSGELSRCL